MQSQLISDSDPTTPRGSYRDILEFNIKGMLTACSKKENCTPNYKMVINEGLRLSRVAKKLRTDFDSQSM